MAKKGEKTVKIILCCLGFIGLAGLHRMHAGKWISGIIWLLTGGLLLIGTILDLAILITKNKMLFD